MEQTEIISLTLPAHYRYLKLIGESIELLLAGLPNQPERKELIYGIKLAVHEIANNVIQHAYGNEQGTIEVTLHVDLVAKCFIATVHDTGVTFQGEVTTPSLDEPQESGYGLFLATALMDEVNYQRQPDGNHWHLQKTFT